MHTLLKGSFFTLFLIFQFFYSFAQQYQITGYIVDSASNEPLAFVNILINDSRNGGMSDIDGHFSIVNNEPISFLKLSYVGYQSVIYIVKSQKQYVIKMSKQTFDLSEINIVAGENPAHRIIRNVLAHRQFNDPENIKSFSYTSYDKMIFTIARDTMASPTTEVADTNDIKLMELMNKQHLFMMESVAEHKYLYPSRSHDKVTAMKVSGFSDPLFVFLLSQSQPTSFYKETISLAGKNFLNPIGAGFEKHYFFWIMDTLYNLKNSDSTFVISFKPIKGKNFDALKGLLYISNREWAITNVIAEPAHAEDPFVIRIQQKYDFIDDQQWFPVQLNTDITFNNISVSSSTPIAIGKSYRKNIILVPEIIRREFDNIAIDVIPEAGLRNEAYWNLYRNDSLTLIERNTYRVIDSLGKVHNLDGMSKMISSLSSGRLPIGLVDLDINKFFRYNQYEKVYLGLGLYTNNNLTRLISTGGYAGYGFGDKTLKYGASLKLNLLKYNGLGLTFRYRNDLNESAGIRYFDDGTVPFSDLNFRNFFIQNWDKVESIEAIANFRIMRYVSGGVGVSKADKMSMFDYAWQQPAGDVSILTSEHTMGYLTAGFRFAWKEKFVRNQYEQVSMGTKYPILWMQLTVSRKGFLDGQVDYNRLDLKTTWSVFNKLAGKTSFILNGGIIDTDAPYSELFNGRGSAGANFSLYSSGSFSTMKPAEFLSDRYASFFLLHNFGKLIMRTKLFDPEISVALNIGIGSLDQPESHRFINFKTMEKGFYESGLVVNNLLKSSFSGIGIGVFYRMGPYSFAKASENLMLRFTIKYSF